jgi:putative ABC transport system permease protein
VGQVVGVGRQRCEIIGVLANLESRDQNERYNNQVNQMLILPISTASHALFEREPSVEIIAHVKDEKRINEARQQIATYLRGSHAVQRDANGDYQDDFDIVTRNDILGAQQASANTFALLLTGLAAVSLGVGGIGIMTVMLVSVSERTREIGVRMAIGARPVDIVAQFLAEAAMLSAVGGVLGVATGILVVPLAAAVNQGVALFAPASIPLGLGVALLVGIVFGLYPAVRAARLDPIEALGYE